MYPQDPFSPSSDPFASPIDPSVPLTPPAALGSPFMRIACRNCTGGRLEVSPPADPTPDDPFIRLPFEYAVAVQPDRKDAPGHLAVDMRCEACGSSYTLLLHADGRMELRDA